MNLYRKVLAAIDLGDTETAVRVVHAALEVIEEGDTLHIISVVPDFGAGVVASFFPAGHVKQAVEKAQQGLHAFSGTHIPKGVSTQHIVGHGSVYDEVMKAAQELSADLIVVGSHRPALRDYVIGPNAERIVRHARQSVLVVRDGS